MTDRPLLSFDYCDPDSSGPRVQLDAARVNYFAGEIVATVLPDERPEYLAMMEALGGDLQRAIPGNGDAAPLAAAARLCLSSAQDRVPPDYSQVGFAAWTDIDVLLAFAEAVSARYRPADQDAVAVSYIDALQAEQITALSKGDARRAAAAQLILAALSAPQYVGD